MNNVNNVKQITDLTGQKFGRLTVLEEVGRRNGRVLWKCQCSCGNTVEVVVSSLQNGNTQSCGCLSRELASKRTYKNLTGQVFGRLTVLEDAGRKRGNVLWKCICECGKTVNVITANLQCGKTQSCGCYKNELISERTYKDLTGQVFGRLTVLEDVGRDKQGGVIWRCLCKCGNTVDVRSSSLQCGETQSCGCLHKERTSETNRDDLTGQKFGRLTVLEDVGRNKHKNVIWKCLCECGNTVDVIGNSLQMGHTQSCGCYFREQHSGENHPNWKGGITPLSQAIRNCTWSKEWRTSIFQRDNFTCVHCNDSTGGNLIAHHIKFFSDIMKEHNITTLEEAIQCEALWSTNNGITLCIECHEREHQRLKAIAKTSNQFSI